jgi:hypothetical protein
MSSAGLRALRPEVGAVRLELCEPLERCASWLWRLADGDGRLICPEHRLEHTGKSACALILFAHLWAQGRGEVWLERAVAQGRRLVARLEREGQSECFTFRPGRHDPFNCSNSVIDGGACADALATLVAIAGERLPAQLAAEFKAASLLHARSYLRYAVLDKGIPAQRAWGLTGLAGAHALEPAEELSRAGIEAVGVLEAIQNQDGSYPYHPLEWGAGHPGAADVSCFYQSRVTGFLLHSLEVLGLDPRREPFAAPLLRGLDYLAHLIGPDGIKPGLVEAKPWYWGAEYEVASHVFDVHALARGASLFGLPQLGDLALCSYGAWAEHLGPDGEPRSHHPAPGRRRSYQCPLFWAAHACWIARALPDLERAAQRSGSCGWPPQAIGPRSQAPGEAWWAPQAGLAVLRNQRLCAFLRGARPAGNLHHGGPRGAGLVRLVRLDEQGRIHSGSPDRRPFAAQSNRPAGLAGEWIGRAGGWAPRRGWHSGASELRFSLWLARAHWRGGRPAAALAAPWDVFSRGVLEPASSLVSSAFERRPDLRLLGQDALEIHGRLCHRDGTAVEGSSFRRLFRIGRAGLEVEERLLSPGRARGLVYRRPAGVVGPAGGGPPTDAFAAAYRWP